MKQEALRIVKDAAKLLLQYAAKAKQIQYKGNVNIVTSADLAVQAFIIDALKKKYPSHAFLAEEKDFGVQAYTYRWILDPIDGTSNFANNLPHYCISLALEEKGSVIIGIVYNPVTSELFVAEQGEGAVLNGKKIMVSKKENMKDCLVATGFPYDRTEGTFNNLANLKRMVFAARCPRVMGAAALDLCYLACGRIDGFWEMGIHPWDHAAASLIVREAGGMITSMDGSPYTITAQHIVASNGWIHKKILSLVEVG